MLISLLLVIIINYSGSDDDVGESFYIFFEIVREVKMMVMTLKWIKILMKIKMRSSIPFCYL
jgi:hypothetical protein